MLDGFERISHKGERLTLSFSKSGIFFSHGVTKAFMHAKRVNVLINNVTRYIAIQEANDDEEAIAFKPTLSFGKEYFRISNKEILIYICNMMKWDLTKDNYVVSGRFADDSEGLQTVIFGLEGATITKRRKRK